MGPFLLFFGIGAAAGIVYVTIRYGIPVMLGLAGCVLEFFRQAATGFAAGVKEGRDEQDD